MLASHTFLILLGKLDNDDGLTGFNNHSLSREGKTVFKIVSFLRDKSKVEK